MYRMNCSTCHIECFLVLSFYPPVLDSTSAFATSTLAPSVSLVFHFFSTENARVARRRKGRRKRTMLTRSRLRAVLVATPLIVQVTREKSENKWRCYRVTMNGDDHADDQCSGRPRMKRTTKKRERQNHHSKKRCARLFDATL